MDKQDGQDKSEKRLTTKNVKDAKEKLKHIHPARGTRP